MANFMETLCDTGRFCKRLSPFFRILSVVIYYIVGVCYYYSTEDWTIIDSLYFVTVSVATIGYGDFHPTSDSGRFFTSFYLIAGLIFVLSAVDELVRYGILKYQSAVMERLFPDFSPKVFHLIATSFETCFITRTPTYFLFTRTELFRK